MLYAFTVTISDLVQELERLSPRNSNHEYSAIDEEEEEDNDEDSDDEDKWPVINEEDLYYDNGYEKENKDKDSDDEDNYEMCKDGMKP